MTEMMVYHMAVSFGFVGVSWSIAFAIWAMSKYTEKKWEQ